MRDVVRKVQKKARNGSAWIMALTLLDVSIVSFFVCVKFLHSTEQQMRTFGCEEQFIICSVPESMMS
jgi:hypothetical protein